MESINEESIKEKLREIIAKELNIEPEGINDNSHIGNDLGIDSADMINFLYDIEDAFGVEVSDEDASDNPTVKSLANLVKEKVAMKS